MDSKEVKSICGLTLLVIGFRRPVEKSWTMSLLQFGKMTQTLLALTFVMGKLTIVLKMYLYNMTNMVKFILGYQLTTIPRITCPIYHGLVSYEDNRFNFLLHTKGFFKRFHFSI